MDHEALAHAAAVVGAFGACGLLLARERLLFLGGLAALVAAEAGLAYALVPDAPSLLTSSAPRIGALGVIALFGLALAAAFVRYPAAAPVALLVVAPFRLSVGLGSQEAFLLLPLYVVLAAAAAALAYRVLRSGRVPGGPVPARRCRPPSSSRSRGSRSSGRRTCARGRSSSSSSSSPSRCCSSIVALTRPRDWTWRALATALVAVTSLFAAIGVYQAWSHTEILAKQDVQLSNAYSAFFRVTSVFQDPSVYGRHLVLGIVVLLTVLWLALVRPALALPVLGLLVVGLYFSYSQTSFVSLFCAVLVVTLIAGDRLTRRVVVGTSAALVLAAGIARPRRGRRRLGPPGDERPAPALAGDLAGLRRPSGRRRGHRLAAAHEPAERRTRAGRRARTSRTRLRSPSRPSSGRSGLLAYLAFLAALGPGDPRYRGAATGRSASRSRAASPRSSCSRSSTADSSRIRSSGGSRAWRPRR